jgi:hypothetical protein
MPERFTLVLLPSPELELEEGVDEELEKELEEELEEDVVIAAKS